MGLAISSTSVIMESDGVVDVMMNFAGFLFIIEIDNIIGVFAHSKIKNKLKPHIKKRDDVNE